MNAAESGLGIDRDARERCPSSRRLVPLRQRHDLVIATLVSVALHRGQTIIAVAGVEWVVLRCSSASHFIEARPARSSRCGSGPDRDARERRPSSRPAELRQVRRGLRATARERRPSSRAGLPFAPTGRARWIVAPSRPSLRAHRGRPGGTRRVVGAPRSIRHRESDFELLDDLRPGAPRLRPGPPAARAIRSRRRGGSSRSGQGRRGRPPR